MQKELTALEICKGVALFSLFLSFIFLSIPVFFTSFFMWGWVLFSFCSMLGELAFANAALFGLITLVLWPFYENIFKDKTGRADPGSGIIFFIIYYLIVFTFMGVSVQLFYNSVGTHACTARANMEKCCVTPGIMTQNSQGIDIKYCVQWDYNCCINGDN